MGVPVGKCPFDLWIYQEILYETQPDIIIESGTGLGGSTLYLASCCDVIGKGSIITIDIDNRLNCPKHKRIRQIVGSSVSPRILDEVKRDISSDDAVLVSLGSDHSKEHVLSEMRAYGAMVTSGSYMIVEDGIAGGHPVKKNHYPGPMEAIEEYLAEDPTFTIDMKREKFMMTFNPKGYLREA